MAQKYHQGTKEFFRASVAFKNFYRNSYQNDFMVFESLAIPSFLEYSISLFCLPSVEDYRNCSMFGLEFPYGKETLLQNVTYVIV